MLVRGEQFASGDLLTRLVASSPKSMHCVHSQDLFDHKD